LKEFAPETIEPSLGYAKVNRALQLIPNQSTNVHGIDSFSELTNELSTINLNHSEQEIQSTSYGHIFVVGDAANAFGAIKAGYNAYYQAGVAARNILQLISNCNSSERKAELEAYEPGALMIKLSFGLVSLTK
jgi:NADH dehydrogenase FAD-containing subunit